MMRKFARCLFAGILLLGVGLALPNEAKAQYPIGVTTVQPVVPGVVGYTAERRGLFGRRVVYRPVVAPVAAAPVTTAVAVAPTVTVARPVTVAPVVTVARPVVTVARPVVPAPVTVRYAPVTSYYAPAYPAPLPVTTYRYPFPAVYPYIGY